MIPPQLENTRVKFKHYSSNHYKPSVPLVSASISCSFTLPVLTEPSHNNKHQAQRDTILRNKSREQTAFSAF
jgi:hypothetical protein